VARHMGAAFFNNGNPFGGRAREGVCANEGKGVECSSAPVNIMDDQAEGDKKRKARASVDEDQMQAHCAQFNGVFAQQCHRISRAILSKLKKKRDKKTKVTFAKFDMAVSTSGVCKWSGSIASQPSSIDRAEDGAGVIPAGCRARGDCSIHSALSELVVKGNLTLGSDVLGTADNTHTIPAVVHLTFGMTADWGGKPFGLVHYLCIKSASVNMPGAVIFLYYRYEPTGKWWARARRLARPIQVDPILSIKGKPILHMAHVSDLLRLQALRDMGGIYMDMDVITVRPFTPLMMTHQFVMGQEGPNGVYGLCNAVMLSAPNSTFVQLWIDHYAEAYDAAIWSMHSVKLPSILAHLWPRLITQVLLSCFLFFVKFAWLRNQRGAPCRSMTARSSTHCGTNSVRALARPRCRRAICQIKCAAS